MWISSLQRADGVDSLSSEEHIIKTMIWNCTRRDSAGIKPSKPLDSARIIRTLMAAVARLRPNHQTLELGVCAVCLSVSPNITTKQRMKQRMIQADEPWMINGQINFRMIVLFGHLLMSYDVADLGVWALATKSAYKASLGGKNNLTEFGLNGSLEGKPRRTDLLQKSAQHVIGVDLSVHQDLLASRFPGIIRSRRGVTARIIAWLYNMVTLLLRAAFSVVAFVFAIARPVLMRSGYLLTSVASMTRIYFFPALVATSD